MISEKAVLLLQAHGDYEAQPLSPLPLEMCSNFQIIEPDGD
jgi:hypothetical protein